MRLRLRRAWPGRSAAALTAEQLIGGGELLWPGEVRLAQGDSYQSPWVYAAHGVGLNAIAQRWHRHVRSRNRKVPADRPVTLNGVGCGMPCRSWTCCITGSSSTRYGT